MILSLERETPEKALKAVREVLEPEPWSCSSGRSVSALWMRQRYFCTFYDAIRTILPAASGTATASSGSSRTTRARMRFRRRKSRSTRF